MLHSGCTCARQRLAAPRARLLATAAPAAPLPFVQRRHQRYRRAAFAAGGPLFMLRGPYAGAAAGDDDDSGDDIAPSADVLRKAVVRVLSREVWQLGVVAEQQCAFKEVTQVVVVAGAAGTAPPPDARPLPPSDAAALHPAAFTPGGFSNVLLRTLVRRRRVGIPAAVALVLSAPYWPSQLREMAAQVAAASSQLERLPKACRLEMSVLLARSGADDGGDVVGGRSSGSSSTGPSGLHVIVMRRDDGDGADGQGAAPAAPAWLRPFLPPGDALPVDGQAFVAAEAAEQQLRRALRRYDARRWAAALTQLLAKRQPPTTLVVGRAAMGAADIRAAHALVSRQAQNRPMSLHTVVRRVPKGEPGRPNIVLLVLSNSGLSREEAEAAADDELAGGGGGAWC